MKRTYKNYLRRSWAATAVVGLSLVSSQAAACGGFFCSTAAPVDQTAERIIFSTNSDNEVTQIVEVRYEGEAEKFAWVLPVPGVPVPGVSSKTIFDRVQQATDPQYFFNDTLPNECDWSDFPASAEGVSIDSADEDDSGGGVTVLDSGSVGPFDYETIALDPTLSDPAAVAVEWLQNNEYDVDERTEEVLGPYLASGLNLIAIRLQEGKETGAIRPLSLQYEASGMSIPIRPTAVSASDDMPIMVWVLGEHRAVPTNYKSLELNELLIDWFDPQSNYDDVVTAAADEAMGQGFVTEYSQPPGNLPERIWSGMRASEVLAENPNGSLEDRLFSLLRNYGRAEGFVSAVEGLFPLREGVTEAQFLDCASCYFDAIVSETDPIYTLDIDAVAGAIDEKIVQPMEDAKKLFEDAGQVTRLYTTMSASEMDRDPTFKLNPDLEDVSNIHTVEREIDCEFENWRVTFPTGEIVYGTGREWPYKNSSEMPANRTILELSTSGEGTVFQDNADMIFDLHGANEFSQGVDPITGKSSDSGSGSDSEPGAQDSSGCSVSPGPSGGSLWALSLLGLGFFARRRKGARA